jgi:hypothetical protein
MKAIPLKLIIASLFFLSMLVIVMLFINPKIDGANGMGLIDLQLCFDKLKGIEIIENWGLQGRNNFINLIYTDYIYAVSYVLFFIALMSCVKLKKAYWLIPILAGLSDWLEDSMEIVFINNPQGFSDALFVVHSFVASAKFVFIIFAVVVIVLKIRKINK